MEIHDYIRILRKRWPTIIAFTVIGIAVAAGIINSTSKVYTASAQVFVAASSADGTAALNNGNSFAQARVQSYTSAINSPTITQAVVNQLKLPISPDALAAKISADAPLNKVLLNLHVKDKSAVEATTIANAVAGQFVAYVQNIERISAGADVSPVKLTVIHPAQIPASPTSPKAKLDLVIGLLAGLLVGLAIAAIRESLDTRIRTVADVGDVANASVLAVVPQDKRAVANPVALRSDEHGPRAEAFRQLRTNLQYIAVDSPPKLIAVTSAMSGEGKSTTSVNLAVTMAEAGLKVCLIDADLRRPAVAKYLGLPAGAGLTSILAGKATFADVLQSVGPNMTVITSGPIPPNPSELLASTQFRSVLKNIADQVSYVVIDCAPLLPVADASQVASAADVTLLVVKAKQTNREQLKQAVEALNRVDAQLGGIVFNMVSDRDSGTYYEYYSAERQPARRLSRA